MSAHEPHSPWQQPGTVQGFVDSPPNATLLSFAEQERARAAAAATGRAGHATSASAGYVLDLGCGAGRNAVPLANQGWTVVGIDTSPAMLAAAADRRGDVRGGRLALVQAAADRVPFTNQVFDLIVAHGVWNLSRTDAEFRSAVREASRVARRGAALFVFTFSRHTLPPEATPLRGESLIFDGFSGTPQCFLSADQLVAELAAAGFRPAAEVRLTEHNRRSPLLAARTPVILEAAFRALT